MQQDQGQELYGSIVEKAWQDAVFKAELISNPKKAIESITKNKLNLPQNTNIIVDDQTDNSVIYLNIPRKIDLDNVELTEEQLESVAGGLVWIPVVIALAVVAYNGYKDGQESK